MAVPNEPEGKRPVDWRVLGVVSKWSTVRDQFLALAEVTTVHDERLNLLASAAALNEILKDLLNAVQPEVDLLDLEAVVQTVKATSTELHRRLIETPSDTIVQ